MSKLLKPLASKWNDCAIRNGANERRKKRKIQLQMNVLAKSYWSFNLKFNDSIVVEIVLVKL